MIKKNSSAGSNMLLLLSVIALSFTQMQANAIKVLNAVSFSTPSCADKEGEISFPYALAGRCFPVTETAASFFDCETGEVLTFTNKTCSPESKSVDEFEIKCYDGTGGSDAAGYTCSDIDASKLLLMYSGNNGCGGEEFGVKTLSGSQLLLMNECTQYATDRSFKVVLESNNVVTSTNYGNGNCEGEATGPVISGPLEECFTSGGKSYFVTRVQDSSARSVMTGLFSFMVVLVTSSMMI